MKKTSRILAMLLIAVFAFSQLPMAALAAEEVSVGTWDSFKSAIENPDVNVITITGGFDAGIETSPIQISRAVRITSESEYTVTLNNASIEVVDGGNLTLDGALVLQGSGDQVIGVQESGEATISGNVKIEAEWYGVWINGGKVNIDGGTISGHIGVRVGGGTVTIGGEAKIISESDTGTGVLIRGGTVTIKDNVEIIADADGLGVYGGKVNIEGGTITTDVVGIYVKDGEVNISGEVEISAVDVGVDVDGGAINVTGGTITASGENSVGVQVDDGTATIGGGTIAASGENSTGVRVEGGEVKISGETKISATNSDYYGSAYGVTVDGGEVNISGETEISATTSDDFGSAYGVKVEEGTINIGGKAKISATTSDGDKWAYGVKVEKGTINIGGEAEISVNSNSGVCVRIRDSKDANIGGRAKIKATYSDIGAKSAVSVNNSTLNIGGEAEITATNSDQYGWALGVDVDVDMDANNSTVTIQGDVKISADDSGVRVWGGKVTISGGTITATEKESSSVGVKNGTVTISGGRLTADRVGVQVAGEDAKVIIDGEVEISAAYSGVRVELGTTTISGGTITATADEGFAILASDGDVNLISSAELVINGDICKEVWGKDLELILTELLKCLPAPISVSVGQKTAEFTLEPGEGVTFGIDDVNTSEALEAGIDANNKVTLTLPVSAGTYELVLGVPLKNGTFKLTVPVTLTPLGSSGAPTPTIPAAGGATRVSYTSSGGTLSLQMPSAKVNEIIEKSGGAAAEFDLSRAANATAARLPGGALSSIAQAGLDVALRLPAGTMTLSSAAVASVATQATDESVRIELRQAAAGTLTEAQRSVVESGDIVLDINIQSGTQKISNFDGSIAVAMPYDGPLPVAVWYLSDAGELERLDCTFSNGVVYFTLDHLSLYVVGQDTEWKNPFTDVKESSWYYDAVAFIAQRGITAGTTATTFSPDATLTRGQFVTMLLRAYEIAPDAAANNFDDGGDTYYTGYLAAAKALGIANGVGDNKFAPDQAITRQEMFTLLYNALGVLGGLPTDDSGRTLSDFTDSDAIASWATEALSALVEKGIVSGSDGRLNPDATTTRAQMAQVMYNLLGK